MKLNSNCFILTGTSGTGKTSLLNYLNALGYTTFEEPVRQVLTEQESLDGPALPSKNPRLFLQTMLQIFIKNLEASTSDKKPCFFDRGIADLIAYAIRFDIDPTEFRQAAIETAFSRKVFILAPWKEIFRQDQYRGKSFETYRQFHQLITSAYIESSYQLIEVPFDTLENRANFVLKNINK